MNMTGRTGGGSADLFLGASQPEARTGYAWALIDAHGNGVAQGAGCLEGTPHRGELMALIEGLRRARDASIVSLAVHTNNDNVRQTGETWIHAWRARGWKRKGGIKHLDLVRQVAELLHDGIRWRRAEPGATTERLRALAREAALTMAPTEAPAPTQQLGLPTLAPTQQLGRPTLASNERKRSETAERPEPEATAVSAVPELIAYTDGGCRGNPGLGGWGMLLIHVTSGRALARRGGESDTTNNRMELQAVIEALRALKRGSRIEIRSDSTYVRNVCSRWLPAWKARGWRKKDGEPIKNLDQIKQLDALLAQHRVSWQWVRGHSGEPGNEYVDELANRAMDNIHAGGHGRDEIRYDMSPIEVSSPINDRSR